ncbi:MAG: response regulator [Phycisphaerales bacterium]
MPREKDVLTTGEVAKICNVAPRTVSKWFDSGQLKGYRIPGSKDRRIPLNALIKFMKAHGIPLDGLVSGKTRVLVCDREDEIVTVIQKLLTEHADYEVRTATSAFEAGIECERFRPNAILLDLHLDGGADGREFCSIIRGEDDLQMAKVIGMSSKLTDGQAHQLRTAGFDGFLKKPFNIKQVIKSIEDACALVY